MRLHAQSHTQSGRLEELEVENTLQSGQQVFSGLQAVQRFRPSGGHGRIAVARGVEILQCVSGNGSEARPGSFAAKRIQTSADGGPASTLNRFHYADTRRQAELPAEERPVLLEQQAARTERLRIFNACLVDLFIRTRTQRPACVLLDIDATDDPTKGLQADRLSAHGFRANALVLLEQVVAYALVLYRQAAARVAAAVARAEVSTLRQQLWKVGAIAATSVRRIWFHFSETWPFAHLWQRVHQAALHFAGELQRGKQHHAAAGSRMAVGADGPFPPGKIELPTPG